MKAKEKLKKDLAKALEDMMPFGWGVGPKIEDIINIFANVIEEYVDQRLKEQK